MVNSINPVRIEGQKTAAFEICDALGDAPDFHFLPVGNAGNITAYWKGFQQYHEAGLSDTLPHMMGFQAAGAAPIVNDAVVEFPETVASAIRIGNPASWKGAKAAAQFSGGLIDSVTDEQILSTYKLLASSEGIFVEPACAASLAGIVKMVKAGRIDSGSIVTATMTGHGLKDPDTAVSNANAQATSVEPNTDAVKAAMDCKHGVDRPEIRWLFSQGHGPYQERGQPRGGVSTQGDQIVVVVSAMGGVTDNLIRLASEINQLPSEREMDMLLATGEQTTIALLAMALHSLDLEAVSLTGAQAGIMTDGVHTKAKIENISPNQVHAMLDEGNVVIVAGFQGMTPDGRITTLGRGGSDLTAIALASALEADLCQIYTDVDGVYTTDPRVVASARKLEEISYDEMLELASLGAKLLQSRSVEFAKKFNVKFEVRSSLNTNPGTIVKEETASMEDVVVRGVSLDKNQAKVTLVGVPDQPGTASRIFSALAAGAINVDMIVQNISHGSATPATDVSFTTDKPDLAKALNVIAELQKEIEFGEVIADEDIAKVSVVGVGMRSHSGIAAKVFETLGQGGINIEMISTSEIKISVVVEAEKGETATQQLHDTFFQTET